MRKARCEDQEKIIEVESKATPNLSYISNVFDMFLTDKTGDFSVAEVEGKVVACGKFTLLPDGSAWLETLRVIPERQGLGIGKRFYERFFDIARLKTVKTMRMYTGEKNVVSKGLAERYGFRQAATYRGARLNKACMKTSHFNFQKVTDPAKATSLLMPYREKWTGFMVLNRTFYSITVELCEELARKGLLYEDPISQSVIALGARFMPEQELHIGVFGGDSDACVKFAMQKGLEKRVQGLSCLFPPSEEGIQKILTDYGFQILPSDFLVMEVHL